MVRPNGFRVAYAINPHMRDANGELKRVDSALALKQWENLKQTFTKLGLIVETIEGRETFPDMVFCANQTLPLIDGSGNQQILLSRMHAAERKGEVALFREWAEDKGFPVLNVTDFDFEGAGDAIWNYGTRELFGGYGFRTQVQAYDVIENALGVNVIRLELINEDFYHLDTCMAVLDATTVAVVPQAFAPASLTTLNKYFDRVIEIELGEARKGFAGNCVSIDGKNIVLQKGSPKFTAELIAHGFTPVEVETSEFIKAGGSAFCMKQFLF